MCVLLGMTSQVIHVTPQKKLPLVPHLPNPQHIQLSRLWGIELQGHITQLHRLEEYFACWLFNL